MAKFLSNILAGARLFVALPALAILALSACVMSPHSRSTAESSDPVALNGYAPTLGETITIDAVDQNTGNLAPLGTAKSVMPGMPFVTPGGFHYTLYPWSWSYPAGMVPQNYWSPQLSDLPDLGTSQGHLELVVSDGGAPFHTFSEAAFNSAMAGTNPLSAVQYSDGNSTVLLDQTGVAFGAGMPWVSVQGMISTPPTPGYHKVAWSVGYYTVEDGKKIYGLLCTPVSGGPYPVIIYNHGGFDMSNGGNVNGLVTASGWTSQPTLPGTTTPVPDGLGQCLDWAKRGWVFATSSYRGERVVITSTSPSFPTPTGTTTWISGGAVEFCLGEVTDVLALANLLANNPSAISVGSASQMVPLNVNGKIFMYGYSHGGCITYRAVEQGAPVSAFSVAEGFTDIRLDYLVGLNHALTVLGWPVALAQYGAALGSGAWQPPIDSPADVPISPPPPAYLPDASHVMAYNWRSAHYFASHGDLAIQRFTSMPILILHGDVDVEPASPTDPSPLNPTPFAQAAEMSADIGATNLFVGPGGSVSPPSGAACIDGPEGAPLPATLTAPNKVCPISFTPIDTGDPCMTTAIPGHCKAIALPLPGQQQQQHYLVVFHNMDHLFGGFAIRNTLDAFVLHNFGTPSGCDGAEPCN